MSKDGEIRIPPFNVVVIKTGETINLPRFLIARWNVRVKWAYEGLLWVGGPQVDPGWVGHLFCPLYNLSDKEVVLRFGDAIALMDFVTTTPFRPGKSIPYKRPPKRVLLEQYRAAELSSALYTLATKKFQGYEKQLEQTDLRVETRVNSIQSRVDSFVLITFSVIAVLFAAVTIFVTRSEQPSWWSPVPLFLISGTALFLSASAWIRPPTEPRLFGRAVQGVVIVLLLAATLLQLRETSPLRSQVNDLKAKVDLIQQQIKGFAPAVAAPPAMTKPPSEVVGDESSKSGKQHAERSKP